MKKEENLRSVMLYIISDDGHNLTETAENFGITRQDVRKMVNEIGDKNSAHYDEALSLEVNEKLSKAISKARSAAGKSSDKGKLFSKDEALRLRFRNVYQQVSLRTLADENGCSFMTISNAINSLTKKDIENQDKIINKK